MSAVLAFDVYGTLIDTQGVLLILREFIGGKAGAFSQTWRSKQLEYSFRRALMRRYVDFSVCTRDALAYASLAHEAPLTEMQQSALLAAYKTLPAFADVKDGLADLSASGHRLFAFSNGSAAAVRGLLDAAGIADLFRDIISVEGVQSFKPDPQVYAHFLKSADASPGEAWLVSSNPFDVLGALSAGMKSAWVQRSPAAIFDPWAQTPRLVVRGLTELREGLARSA